MQSPSDFLRDYIVENKITHITPQEVLDVAKDPECPIHSFFQWDDAAAANSYRVWQARQLIASIKITVEHRPDTQVRMMVSVPTDRGEKGYMLLTEAMKSPSAKESLVREMTAKVRYWKEQAELLDSDVVEWLDEFPDANVPVTQPEAPFLASTVS